MNNKELQLVTYEQAKRLKEAGFDWITEHAYIFYNDTDSLKLYGGYMYYSYEKNWFQAPSVCLALKWFRDVKYIYAEITMQLQGADWEFYYYVNPVMPDKPECVYKSYE